MDLPPCGNMAAWIFRWEVNILKPEYKELFTDEGRNLCRERLMGFGYFVG